MDVLPVEYRAIRKIGSLRQKTLWFIFRVGPAPKPHYVEKRRYFIAA
jgi:hypothetical protein